MPVVLKPNRIGFPGPGVGSGGAAGRTDQRRRIMSDRLLGEKIKEEWRQRASPRGGHIHHR